MAWASTSTTPWIRRFRLKRGVKFHDGTPFNAEAVKFTLDRIVDPATRAGQAHDQIGPYDRTEIVNDYMVRIPDGIREKGGQKLVIDFPIIGRPRDRAMAESVQASLREIGMDVKVTPLERGAFAGVRRQKRFDVDFMWFSYGDPDVLRTIFHSSNVNAFNCAQYQVPEVDRMLEQAPATTNKALRSCTRRSSTACCETRWWSRWWTR